MLAYFGLAYGLKRVSQYKIIAARLRAKNLQAQDIFSRIEYHPRIVVLQRKMGSLYEQLKTRLAEWENAAACSRAAAKQRFRENLRLWNGLYTRALRFAELTPFQ